MSRCRAILPHELVDVQNTLHYDKINLDIFEVVLQIIRMWISREIETTLAEKAGKRPALLLTGCRQSGKTSILKRVFPDHNYVTLDIPGNASEAEAEGLEFIKRIGMPVIIDEIQYAPQLFRFIKVFVDEQRKKNGRFLLTGSQKFSLMQGVSESLAGRVSVCNLHSLSLKEIEDWQKKKINRENLLDLALKGGYPEIHASSLDPEDFYGDYLATYIERDVRQIVNVKYYRDFDRFLRLLALRSGQLLSMNSIASDVGVSSHTIKSWLSVLEISNIVFLLKPFYQNMGKRTVKAPKVYFNDTGLLLYLLGIRKTEDLLNSPLLGNVFETLAFGQVLRYFANRGLKDDLYFFRDSHGHEVDFIIPSGNRLHLIECKWSLDMNRASGVFGSIEKIIPPDLISKKTVVTQRRDIIHAGNGVLVSGCVDPGDFL